jgi:hypothetical protein
MNMHFTIKSTLAFMALVFICHEVHELVHTTVAYFQCGCWGTRDFNVWKVCDSCTSSANTIWATIAGPFITYLQIWLGWLLMSRYNTISQRTFGFALVWANVPFARFITVAMKGGDEGVITRTLVGQSSLSLTVWLLEIGIVLLLILPALLRAWKFLASKRAWVFIAFLIVPMLLQYVTMHKLGSQLLQAGVLAETGILGSPLLVNVWNAVWLLVLISSYKHIGQLFQEASEPVFIPAFKLQNI